MVRSLQHDIQRDFPQMPDEVLRLWLLPHAQRAGVGWPPVPAPVPPPGPRGLAVPPTMAAPWQELFAGRPLTWWQARMWHCEPFEMALEHMSHATRFQVEQLTRAQAEGRDLLRESRARMTRIAAHIAAEGTWPVPVVAFPDADGLALVDGHHRLAALEQARRAGGAALKARHLVWLALPGSA